MKFNFIHVMWLVIVFLLFTNISFYVENQKNITNSRAILDYWFENESRLVELVCDVNYVEWVDKYKPVYDNKEDFNIFENFLPPPPLPKTYTTYVVSDKEYIKLIKQNISGEAINFDSIEQKEIISKNTYSVLKRG